MRQRKKKPSGRDRVANRIREFRLERGYTQEQLAELVGTGRTYISEIESGVRNATLDTVDSLAAALEVDIETLFTLERAE